MEREGEIYQEELSTKNTIFWFCFFPCQKISRPCSRYFCHYRQLCECSRPENYLRVFGQFKHELTTVRDWTPGQSFDLILWSILIRTVSTCQLHISVPLPCSQWQRHENTFNSWPWCQKAKLCTSVINQVELHIPMGRCNRKTSLLSEVACTFFNQQTLNKISLSFWCAGCQNEPWLGANCSLVSFA